ncbi:DUF2953 domain-containing protein [Dorea sp. D27]|uniref:DUF2953 domain-containing protein n=1 Tax=Dorea sp. D27 TaxID=658665 RepID=UPI0006736782|nr:DUF2953 domain-containing protein [Dorea sp. D27]KMZ54906.1 hypothetical protein HMPREF0980_00902 [Dorea sp. D27]
MLHIILLILKIIGIIIAAILGILVLLVCIVLFVPFRYRVEAASGGTSDSIQADMTCTWLMNLIKFTALYHDKKFVWNVRIFFKKMSGEEQADADDIKKFEEEVETDETEYEEILEETEETDGHGAEEHPGLQKKDEKEPRLPERAEAERKENAEDDQEEKTGSGKKRGKFKNIYEKCRQTFRKIKCTILRLCDKIKALSEKKEKLSAFILDDTHKTAFAKVKKEAFRLLRRLKPRTVKAKIHYGFEDPYRTGQVLAGLGILYPFLGKDTEIVPDFEQKILEGTLLVKGKVHVLHFVMLLWKLFWCREVRATYKHIRSFEL